MDERDQLRQRLNEIANVDKIDEALNLFVKTLDLCAIEMSCLRDADRVAEVGAMLVTIGNAIAESENDRVDMILGGRCKLIGLEMNALSKELRSRVECQIKDKVNTQLAAALAMAVSAARTDEGATK
jgi:hypothetical protein